MACAGIDFGNRASVVAIARRGGIDICVNEVSNRATPSVVSFQGPERHVGEAAASIAAQNYRNTVPSVQRLLGVSCPSPFANAEASRLTCQIVPEPKTGATAATVSYSGLDDDSADDGQVIFSFQALCAMLISNLMTTASNEYKAPVKDLVISVPVYYTEAQRQALLHAATIANVNVLRVVNEHAAIALSYGIFRTKELPDTTPIKVAFVDIGESSTTVTIAAFTNARCDIIAVASEASLGGRDLDDIIVEKFAKQFKETYSIDVLSKPKPTARLRKEAEKIKKVLSTVPEAPLNIECLMNDVDVRGHFKREDLESLAAPLLEKIRALCERAIADANLAEGEQLTAVEVVGGSTRVPSFKNVIAEVFKKTGAPIRTTLNADECIARGCALMSAMLSPAFKVRDYVVADIVHYAVDAEKVFTDGSPNEALSLVPKGNAFPCTKVMKFKAPGPLSVNVRYKVPSSLPSGEDAPLIRGFLVEAPNDPVAKVHAKVRVTSHGTIEMPSAQLVEEVMVEEEVVVKKPTEMANGESAPNGTDKTDTPMPDAPADGAVPAEATPDKNGTSDANGAAPKEDVKTEDKAKTPDSKPEGGEPPAKEAAITEKRMVKKKKTTDLKVTPIPGIGCTLTADMVLAATEKEGKMKANDLYIKERSEAMNSLEAYVYDLRSRIDEYSGDLKAYGPESLRSELRKDLESTEDWIYSEEAETAQKSAFVEKRNELVKKANPLMFRKREEEERPVRIKVLEAAIERYKQVVVPGVEAYAHISEEEKNKLLNCVEGAAIWLKEQSAKQAGIAKDVDPVLTCDMLNTKLREVDAICSPIQNTPKPEPPKEEKKDEKDKDAKEGTDGKDVKETSDAKEDVKDGKAMETEPATAEAGKDAESGNTNGEKMDVDQPGDAEDVKA